MTLALENVTGGYGNLPVIKNLSFEVPDGQIVGLIGLNGAGKSTTIKHIIGLLTPMQGAIKIDGQTLAEAPEAYRQAIAYVPETPVLYPELTLKEHLELTMMAYDLDAKTTWPRVNEMLEQFRLANKLDWFPANFSKGMKQKVMIVAAFMTNARLYIIDEPFTGLDPLAVHDLLDLVALKKQAGAAVLMSTHILATAQQYADQFVLLNNGQVRATGDLTSLQTQFNLADADLDAIYMAMTREA
ncbi:MAG: ABC transporter ATP-binding protein [Lactobacillus sp.]|jgi:ABC-2 type transport system ATP-binding protein|uniref:ABC transporter ATP-binding protein n=1 Tax=Lacticaseibacillus suilingensis TaxID=2799577 RepID=A0ABW4BGC3_9LACO|nr:ABC transporter ATP-binding protein [Lacticaseibacillus suilingensis]MCI1894874.1 ABC transporter ATP-binding protein [Lactobacillus sp.]MCI1917462.1 ABC transporter ATP-binding protein [Lactobacillus sp.]MCI1940617.1 ABC transporter ATP-binding protein [Lactobacillus sp.]MCI1971303.1 ABC transporter ATP-binding protein [Lactobacillus sp.]MCI2017778.1 ABC transporter ATP-binding protein [Lactobacillus sp.]